MLSRASHPLVTGNPITVMESTSPGADRTVARFGVARSVAALLVGGVLYELPSDDGFDALGVLAYTGLVIFAAGFFELANRLWPDHGARERSPGH